MRCLDLSERLRALFPDFFMDPGWQFSELPQSGSNRCYVRAVRDGAHSVIVAINEDVAENEAFIYLSGVLGQAGVNVPRVIMVSDDRKAYVQDDLGSTSLFDCMAPGISSGSFDDGVMDMLSQTMKALARIHWSASSAIDFSHCYPIASMSRRDMMWDLNYFKYYCLKPSGTTFDEAALEDDFERLTADLLAVIDRQPEATFMYRDFQSRNVMIHDGAPWFIDFQGGRRGPFLYDLVSFLWQVRAHFPAELRERLIVDYFDEATNIDPRVTHDRWRDDIPLMVLFRSLQVMGTYGFRGNFEGKAQFRNSIPGALDNVEALRPSWSGRYPAIFSALASPCLRPCDSSSAGDSGLTVTVVSFSYRKGLPADDSGNGGGFVFDCRAIHNPGRYDQYKTLTGMDAPVREFLENDGEIVPFLDSARRLVDAAVDKYLKRGFNNLQVAFGCTGGRHRSVYSAECMARHLASRGDVAVRLLHREQGIDKRMS